MCRSWKNADFNLSVAPVIAEKICFLKHHRQFIIVITKTNVFSQIYVELHFGCKKEKQLHGISGIRFNDYTEFSQFYVTMTLGYLI